MIDNDKYSNSKNYDGLPWSWFVPGLGQYNFLQIFSKKNGTIISSSSLSDVAKGKINIQSGPNKGKHHKHKDIQQAILTTKQSLTFN